MFFVAQGTCEPGKKGNLGLSNDPNNFSKALQSGSISYIIVFLYLNVKSIFSFFAIAISYPHIRPFGPQKEDTLIMFICPQFAFATSAKSKLIILSKFSEPACENF